MVVISYFKGSLELEDAEQAYYSQWWRLGYDDQPPLYTWLQKLFNSAFGVTKFSFSFLRGLLFGAVLITLFRFGRAMLKDSDKAQLALLATVLVPVFIDFAFRRLSHTLLLCLAVLISFLTLDRLVHKKSLRNYALLGLCFGLGILSKYNYVLFLGAFFVASFFDSTLKGILWNSRILLSLLVAFLLFSPHLYWLLQEGHLFELEGSLALKTGASDSSILILGPVFQTLKSLFELALPVFVFFGGILLLKKGDWLARKTVNWLVVLGIVQLTVLFVFFIVMDATEVHARWLLPLLLPYLVLLIDKIDFKVSIQKWGIIAFVTVLIFQVMRTPMEQFLGIGSDIHYKYDLFAEKLSEDFENTTWILPNVTYGGQIRWYHPNQEIFTLDDFSIPAEQKKLKEFVLITAKKNQMDRKHLVDSLFQYGPNRDDLYFYSIYGTTKVPFQSPSSKEN